MNNGLVVKIRNFVESKNFSMISVVGLFVVAGLVFALVSRAASNDIVLEPENGALSNGASIVDDSSASNGRSIKFGSASSDGVYTFSASGLTGGGFQNVMAISPFKDSSGSRPYLLGADVSGIHRSFDKGKLWTPVPSPQHVASLLWSDSVAGKAYVAANEGLYVTTNWGASWSKRAGSVNFDANGTYFVSGEHPRPTGNLIAQDTSGSTKYLWLATETQGVKQSTNDGTSWNVTTLAGDHLRAIAADPNNPNVLYVAIRNTGTTASRNGIWRSTNARATNMSFTKMTNFTSTTPEELWAINDNGSTKIYAASAKDGVFMYNGSTWTARNNGLDTGSTGGTWQSITGYRATGGNIVLYAGATDAKAVTGGPHRRAIMKSTDGGGNWTSISDSLNITLDWNEYGTDILSWLNQISYHNFAGNSAWTASYLSVDPDATDVIQVAGRGGVWVGTQGTGKTKWQPGTHGLMVTVNMSVATDPAVAGRVADGNMDYTSLISRNGGVSFERSYAQGAETTGDVVVFDVEPGANGVTPLYVGASKRGQNTGSGKVFSNPNPFGGGNWIDEGLPVNSDVPALGVGHDANGQRVILAGVTQMGFWRKAGNSWTEVTGGPFGRGGGGGGSFAWKKGTPIVYAIDGGGVWRSKSAGAQGSWVKISGETAVYQTLNALVLDPINTNYLYVSKGSVKRITNAETTTGTAATTSTNVGGTSNAGPIAVSQTGDLIITDRGGKQLLRSSNPRASSPVFTKISDGFFANNGANIRSMAIGVDDRIYTADNGQGVMVGAP